MKRLLTTCSALLALAALTACAPAGPKGSLRFDNDITRLFARGETIPNHVYYTTDSAMSRGTTAVIALDARYTLTTKSWDRLGAADGTFSAWLQELSDRDPACRFRGARIFAANGSPAGYWYGKWTLTRISEPEPFKLDIFSPAEPSSGPCKPRKRED